MNWFTQWRSTRALDAITNQLARIEQQGKTIMGSLDDIKANEAKLHALITKLLALVRAAPAGTFTPEQQAEIDGIVVDQNAALGEADAAAAPSV